MTKPERMKKKVNGKIAVVDVLVDRAGGECLEDVVPDDNKGCHTAQAVEELVMGLAVGKCG